MPEIPGADFGEAVERATLTSSSVTGCVALVGKGGKEYVQFSEGETGELVKKRLENAAAMREVSAVGPEGREIGGMLLFCLPLRQVATLQRSVAGSVRIFSYHSCLAIRMAVWSAREARRRALPWVLRVRAAAVMHDGFHQGKPFPSIFGERGWRVLLEASEMDVRRRNAECEREVTSSIVGRGGLKACSQASQWDGSTTQPRLGRGGVGVIERGTSRRRPAWS